MKNRMLLLTVFTFVSFHAFAQKSLSRLINQSYKAIDKGQYEKAFLLYDQAFEIDSTDYRIYLSRGIANLFRSKPQLAVDELLKSAACGCDDPLIAYYLGLAYYDLEDYENAVLHLKAAQESDPADLDFNVDLADAYLEQGSDSCLYFFDKALAKKPRFSYAYRRKGDFFYNQDLYQECLPFYSQAIRFNKKDTHSYYCRSYAKYRLSDYRGAEQDIMKAIDAKEGNAEKYFYLGIYRYSDDNYTGAKQAFESAIALDSTDWESLYYLAQIQYEEDHYEEALTRINQSISLQKDDPDLFLLRGYIIYEMDDSEGACTDWLIAGGLGSDEARKLAVDYCGETMAER